MTPETPRAPDEEVEAPTDRREPAAEAVAARETSDLVSSSRQARGSCD